MNIDMTKTGSGNFISLLESTDNNCLYADKEDIHITECDAGGCANTTASTGVGALAPENVTSVVKKCPKNTDKPIEEMTAIEKRIAARRAKTEQLHESIETGTFSEFSDTLKEDSINRRKERIIEKEKVEEDEPSKYARRRYMPTKVLVGGQECEEETDYEKMRHEWAKRRVQDNGIDKTTRGEEYFAGPNYNPIGHTNKNIRFDDGQEDAFLAWYDDYVKKPAGKKNYEGKAMKESRRMRESSADDKILALAEHLDCDADDISIRHYCFDTPKGEWRVLTEDERDEAVKDMVQELFNEIGLEQFSEDWLNYNVDDIFDGEAIADITDGEFNSASEYIDAFGLHDFNLFVKENPYLFDVDAVFEAADDLDEGLASWDGVRHEISGEQDDYFAYQLSK